MCFRYKGKETLSSFLYNLFLSSVDITTSIYFTSFKNSKPQIMPGFPGLSPSWGPKAVRGRKGPFLRKLGKAFEVSLEKVT